jgi:hypothetical protein
MNETESTHKPILAEGQRESTHKPIWAEGWRERTGPVVGGWVGQRPHARL